MAANRIGKLYQYTGKGSLPLWENPDPFSYNEMGNVEAYTPFIILDKFEDPGRFEYWIKVLVEEKVGWIKSSHLNIMWIDPEEYQ
jgi:hypothetical protein